MGTRLSFPQVGLQLKVTFLKIEDPVTHQMKALFMIRKLAIGLILFLFTCSPAFAGATKELVLKDGSRIQAEILSFSNGVYRLKSNALGEFSVPEDEIKSIHFSRSRKGFSSAKKSAESRQSLTMEDAGIGPQEIAQMKQQMISDPEIMQLLQELRRDPSIQKILEDQDLMNAINQGDLGKVSADPKIKSLMNNGTVGKILEKSLPPSE